MSSGNLSRNASAVVASTPALSRNLSRNASSIVASAATPPRTRRTPQPARTLEDDFPELYFWMLPKHVRDRIRPPQRKPKKKASTATKSPKKGSKTTKMKKASKPAGKKTKVVAKKKAGGATSGLSFGTGAGGSLTFGSSSIGGPALSKSQSATANTLFRRGTETHKWQFQLGNGEYKDYAPDASQAVELAHSSWLLNPHIDVRSVKSGDWEYMIDFNLMQQQNIGHGSHRIRKIRRVPVDTPSAVAPPSPAKKKTFGGPPKSAFGAPRTTTIKSGGPVSSRKPATSASDDDDDSDASHVSDID